MASCPAKLPGYTLAFNHRGGFGNLMRTAKAEAAEGAADPRLMEGVQDFGVGKDLSALMQKDKGIHRHPQQQQQVQEPGVGEDMSGVVRKGEKMDYQPQQQQEKLKGQGMGMGIVAKAAAGASSKHQQEVQTASATPAGGGLGDAAAAATSSSSGIITGVSVPSEVHGVVHQLTPADLAALSNCEHEYW